MSITITHGRENGKAFTMIHLSMETNRRAVRQGMYDAGARLHGRCRKEILDKSKKTGRLYRISRGKTKVRRNHRASAPGEFPAQLYGNLRDSIGFEVHGVDEFEFGSRSVINKRIVGRGEVQRTTSTGKVIKYPYNIVLEDPKKLNRPYLKPTTELEEQAIAAIMLKTIDDVMNGRL